MTSISRYYTPDTEEFGIDFEFQYLRKGNWTDDVITFFEEAHEWVNNQVELRVKHLDQEDIESLGFEKDLKEVAGMNWRMISFQKGELIADLFVELPKDLIRGDGTNGYVKPQTVRIEDSCKVLFNGILKNKSELKKILKQIGYEQER